MAGFVRATRNGQFTESTQKLIAEGINHYQALRESLGKLAGHRGYNAYFESWTPPLMEDDSDMSNINELFVQETVDPRIENVMPILSKLHKKISEMSEVNELSEWADKLIEGDEDIEDNEVSDAADNAESDLTEAPGAETLAHNVRTDAKNMRAFDLEEEESLTSNNPQGVPEGVEELPQDALDLIDEYIAKIEPDADRDEMIQSLLRGTIHSSELEYALQDDLDEGILDTIKSGIKKVGGKILDKIGHGSDEDLLRDLKDKAGVRNPQNGKPSMAYSDVEKRTDEVDTGQYDARKSTPKGGTTPEQEKSFREKVRQYGDELEQRQKDKSQGVAEGEFAGDYATGEAGQWRNKGPKANKPATIGDLVGEGQDDLDTIRRLVRK